MPEYYYTRLLSGNVKSKTHLTIMMNLHHLGVQDAAMTPIGENGAVAIRININEVDKLPSSDRGSYMPTIPGSGFSIYEDEELDEINNWLDIEYWR